MKNEEIIKALKCCSLSNNHQDKECDKCPLRETYNAICQNLLAHHALNLINRQKMEIDNLKHGGEK